MPKEYRPYLALFILSLLFASASIWHLSAISESSGSSPARQYPAPAMSMMADYTTDATNMVEHGVFSRATTSPYTPDAWRTPGYPAFLTPFYIFFKSWYPALFTQVFLLFLTAALMYAMAKRIMPETWALVLSVVYIALPDTLLATSSLLTETVFVFLFMAGLYLCLFSEWSSVYVRFAFTGILFALATYVRPASLYLILFFIPAYLLLYVPWKELGRKQIIAALILIFAFVGTLMPWYIRNEHEFGVFAFASTGPYVLFRQNATQFYEAFHHVPNLDARYVLEDMAGIPRGSVPTDFKYSAAMQKVATDVITAHPFRYMLFHSTTLMPFFTSSGAHDYWRFEHDLLPNFNPPPEPSLIQALHPFSVPTLFIVIGNHGWFLVENVFWGLVLLLTLYSLWRSHNRRLMWMFFVIIMYFALVTGPIAHARYRMPVDPLLLLCTGSALVVLIEKYRIWNTRP